MMIPPFVFIDTLYDVTNVVISLPAQYSTNHAGKQTKREKNHKTLAEKRQTAGVCLFYMVIPENYSSSDSSSAAGARSARMDREIFFFSSSMAVIFTSTI